MLADASKILRGPSSGLPSPPAPVPTSRCASVLVNTAASPHSLLSASSEPTPSSHATSCEAPSPLDTGCGDAESFVSIVDDPFFIRLDPPDLDATLPSFAELPHGSHGTTKSRPPPYRESLTRFRWLRRPPIMDELNIAVIGGAGAGKSTLIQAVLGLPRPPLFHASTVRIAVDSVSQSITLLEFDLSAFQLNSSHPINWPKLADDRSFARVDGAIVVYDVVNQASMRGLSQMMAALSGSGLPAALVACKCDRPKEDWEVDADAMANHKIFKSCVTHYKFSTDRPEMARACLLATVRIAMTRRLDDNSEAIPRRRAQSAANLEAPDGTSGRTLSQHSKHSRASPDFSILRSFPDPQPSDGCPPSGARGPKAGLRVERSGDNYFLELEESDGESHEYTDELPILQRCDGHVERYPKSAGVTLADLVNRLLATRLSRADNNFVDVFLCLYRKFATPGELLSAIIVRLGRARDDETVHFLIRTATQLRIIEVVAKWVSLYPGDFARPNTRRILENLIARLSRESVFLTASQQMHHHLLFNAIVDEDAGWAQASDAGDDAAGQALFKDVDQLSDGLNKLQLHEEAASRLSNSSVTSITGKGSMMSNHLHLHFNSYDDYEREAAFLEPRRLQPMNKFRYRILMDISDDDIANELTRIDWIMFSSIRIRDFIRHVSLSAAEKEKCKDLRNIDRMINYFNHVAKWVTNMILLRDKAKHRAQILEKLMNVALKLRQLNNYNGLAAVLAGITGTAVHRLVLTRGLVSANVQKRFARLVLLMGTQKSHFAYRLAWENSPLPRIPFIPLHRRDLVSTEQGSKTLTGPNNDLINWKKFEILGEVLLPMMRSQGSAYPNLAKHDAARDLILDCHMPTDEEEIYQRSLQVESSSLGSAEPSKKGFPWFAK